MSGSEDSETSHSIESDENSEAQNNRTAYRECIKKYHERTLSYLKKAEEMKKTVNWKLPATLWQWFLSSRGEDRNKSYDAKESFRELPNAIDEKIELFKDWKTYFEVCLANEKNRDSSPDIEETGSDDQLDLKKIESEEDNSKSQANVDYTTIGCEKLEAIKMKMEQAAQWLDALEEQIQRECKSLEAKNIFEN